MAAVVFVTGTYPGYAPLIFWFRQLNRIPLGVVQASKPTVRVALLVNLN